jgi:hypothetical protein
LPLIGEVAMNARDHAIFHFAEMSRFAAQLANLPAQILDHAYTYASYGSWTVTFRRRGRLFRLRYAGRAQTHTLERSTSAHSPHTWKPVWKAPSLNSGPPADILDRIEEAARAP